MNTQQVILTIPQKLYQRAKELAQRRNQDINQLLADSIVLDEEPTENPFELELDSAQEAVIAQEETAFLKLHPVLWQKYPGQYVAIQGGELVDHDKDLAALYLRVKKQYPDRFVWISPVKPEPIEEFVFRSPRLVGHT